MLSKQELQEATAVILGVSGFLAVAAGTACFTGGLVGVATIKVGEVLKTQQQTFEKAVPLGSMVIGTGMMMTGLGLVIARSYQRRQPKQPATDTSIWKQLEQQEAIKKACRGCQYYRGGGNCSLYTLSQANCKDYTVKQSCSGCKYHINNQYLAYAVHPQLVNTESASNCPDWSPVETTPTA